MIMMIKIKAPIFPKNNNGGKGKEK